MLTIVFSAVCVDYGVSACSRPIPRVTEYVLQRIKLDYPGMTEDCLEKIKFGGFEAIPKRTDQCFVMTKPQIWQGLWLDAFESQRFCPTPTNACNYHGDKSSIWITFAGHNRPNGGRMTGQTFAIEFVGRRTLSAGQHGHMGTSRFEIIVDRLISLKPLAT